jgi:hypothetical protein
MAIRYGCKPGTKAAKDACIMVGGHRLDRCPHAIARDASALCKTWVAWAIRWAHAKRQGSLGTLLPDPSPRSLELMEIVEEQWYRIDVEEQKRFQEEADRRRNRINLKG